MRELLIGPVFAALLASVCAVRAEAPSPPPLTPGATSRAVGASGGDVQSRRFAADQPGPYSVLTQTFPGAVDPKRHNRSVPMRVQYPGARGPFPLLVFSHGGAGNWDANVTQAQHLASHGYVVVCPTHVDSSNERVRYYMSGDGGGMGLWEALHRITCDAGAALERPRDISFAIDTAIEWNRSGHELKGKIDVNRIGVIGHSYGAYTAQVVCGATPLGDHLIPRVERGSERLKGLDDQRVKAGVALSPQGPGTVCFDRGSFRSIDRPMLWMSGSKDSQKSAAGKIMPPSARREGFDLMPAKDKYLLWLENGDHMGYSYNPDSWLEKLRLFEPPAHAEMQRIAKAMSVIFFDAYLKNDLSARAQLNERYANSLCGKAVPRVQWLQK